MLNGGGRNEQFDYPDEHWYYYQMADRFGWTPDEVDNLPAGEADWLLAIAATVEQVKAEKAETAHK